MYYSFVRLMNLLISLNDLYIVDYSYLHEYIITVVSLFNK